MMVRVYFSTGGYGKIGTHGNKLLVDQKYVRYKYVPYQYTEYQYVLLCHTMINTMNNYYQK